MSISAGNYIIRSAIDENTVLLTQGGSVAKGGTIISGALTEADNRCYWKAAVVSSTYNSFYNIKAGTASGYARARAVASGRGLMQSAFASATGTWNVVLSGNTMTVNGNSVNTYFIQPKSDNTLYLTVREDGGAVYLTTVMDDTTQQEFYFDASTYVNTQLPTPTALRINGSKYVVYAGSGTNSVYPEWKSSSTAVVYEMRYKTRQFDMSGIASDWSDWSAWTMTTAAKSSAGIMKSATAVSLPAVDNSSYSKSDTQIEVRLTSAKTSGAYNKTGTITHGAAVSQLIRKWKEPTLTISALECTQYGLKVSYSCDYAIAGNKITTQSILDGSEELMVSAYGLKDQDYQGDYLIPWNKLTRIPDENDTLDITVNLVETNGIAQTTATASLTVTYNSEEGLAFSPTYTTTSRMSIEAKVSAYDEIECYMRTEDLEGNEVWTEAEEIASDDANYRIFDIIPQFGSAPTVMWVITNELNGVTSWGYKKETLSSAYSMDTLSYVWNWVDDNMVPHAYIMKYRANAIVQPSDASTLPATKYMTTGREYPIFRYSKSISRLLSVDGAILNREADTYSTRADAELFLTANHAVYRQPNGKWYQVAIQSVSFTREMTYDVISVQQEAESR